MNMMKTAMLIAFMTALFMGIGLLVGGRAGMLIAFGIAVLTNFFSYWNADKLVLRMHNAQEVDAATAPEYYRIVEALAANAGLPMPRVFLIHEDQPNAFATGRNPANAAVAATTGLLERLTPREVAGVMAHELAHVQNRDTLIMTLTATLAGAISMLGNFAFLFGGNRGNTPMGMIGTLAAILVAPFAAMLVQMAISRTREYSADRRGAEITGDPAALASALAKIAAAAGRTVNQNAERNPATAHMFIINPLNGQRMDSLFSTHPNPQNRIDALAAMTDIASGESGGLISGRRGARLQGTAQPAASIEAGRGRGGMSDISEAGPWSRGADRGGGASVGGSRDASGDASAKGPWG